MKPDYTGTFEERPFMKMNAGYLDIKLWQKQANIGYFSFQCNDFGDFVVFFGRKVTRQWAVGSRQWAVGSGQ